MCLALPAEVIEINGRDAVANVDGVHMPVSLALLDGVEVGDYVVLHVGFALAKIDPDEAARQLEIMAAGGDFDVSQLAGDEKLDDAMGEAAE